MRAMVYTATNATAAELLEFGSVLKVVPREALRRRGDGGCSRHRGEVADRDPGGQGVAQRHRPGRRPQRSYRFEQGFTFELNLSGVADEARDAFVEKRDATFDQ